MGLDIGYNLYHKKPMDEENKLLMVNEDDIGLQNNVRGRTDTTYSWGEYFDFSNPGKDIVPVFQKGLDGKSRSEGSYLAEYRYMDFGKFKDRVMSAVEDAFAEARRDKVEYIKSINDKKKEIEELRGLQKTCSKGQEYAFDRWEERIQELKECINDIQEEYDTFDDDDYGDTHAVYVKHLLENMERDLKKDEYYVIPYFSF